MGKCEKSTIRQQEKSERNWKWRPFIVALSSPGPGPMQSYSSWLLNRDQMMQGKWKRGSRSQSQLKLAALDARLMRNVNSPTDTVCDSFVFTLPIKVKCCRCWALAVEHSLGSNHSCRISGLSPAFAFVSSRNFANYPISSWRISCPCGRVCIKTFLRVCQTFNQLKFVCCASGSSGDKFNIFWAATAILALPCFQSTQCQMSDSPIWNMTPDAHFA